MRMSQIATVFLAGMAVIALATVPLLAFPVESVADEDSMTGVETEANYEPEPPSSVNDLYPRISERFGQETVNNEEEASDAVDFDIRFPRTEPDYELQLAAIDRIENGSDYIYLFYSSSPMTDDMTINQFWEQGGIWIIYQKNATEYVNEYDGRIYTSYINFTAEYESIVYLGLDAYKTDVNGYQAIAIADVHRQFVPEPHSHLSFAVHDPAQVDFVAGNTYVTLQGYKETDELIRIAESIPFEAGHHH